MINKKNLKQRFENFLTKKHFAENYYQKIYVRKNFIDTNSFLYNYKKNLETGFSKVFKILTYSHVHNNKFTFNSFLNKKNIKNKLLITNFYSSLITIKKQNKNFFFLLKPLAGGFRAYFSGMIGFIPLSNILFFVKILSSKIKRDHFFILVYSFLNISKTFKSFRVCTDFIKLKVILCSKKKNFSFVKKTTPRRFLLNSLFLFKKSIDTQKKIKTYEINKF